MDTLLFQNTPYWWQPFESWQIYSFCGVFLMVLVIFFYTKRRSDPATPSQPQGISHDFHRLDEKSPDFEVRTLAEIRQYIHEMSGDQHHTYAHTPTDIVHYYTNDMVLSILERLEDAIYSGEPIPTPERSQIKKQLLSL